MPENIAKVYHSSNQKNGVRKGSGSWHNEPVQTRFEHIKRELSRYCDSKDDYDFLDLVWHIKNAVIGDIYFSKEVYDGIKDPSIGYWKKYYNTNSEQDKIIQRIMNRKTSQNNGDFDEICLEIKKWMGKKESNGKLVFEHIVPANLYIEELIRAYDKKEFNLNYFKDFRKKICVCIVTKDEDDLLNQKHLRESMPKGKEDWKSNPFARYDEVGIKIYGK